jgi:serine/threonine protein kinase
MTFEDELAPGALLKRGAYQIESTICSGGFGIVYRALSKSGKVVALKEFFVENLSTRNTDNSVGIPSHRAAEIGELYNLFCEEGWWPGLLSHPNVMRSFEFFEDNATGYIVLEFINGADLHDIVANQPDWLEPRQIIEIAARLSDGLAYLHRNGVVHGDIAPDNILMRGPVDPVLIDFGSSLFGDEGEIEARPPARLRAVKDGYSAPEIYDQKIHPSPASDIYSLGATLHFMIDGSPPARKLTDPETKVSASQGLVNREGLPEEFLVGIASALSPEPQERPTATDFADICKTTFT